MSNPSRPPLLNTNLRWFLLGMILANIAGQMAYSMLSLYLLELGASVAQVGLVFTVASLVPMAAANPGRLVVGYGRRLRMIALGELHRAVRICVVLCLPVVGMGDAGIVY